jgi:hypothetical protein
MDTTEFLLRLSGTTPTEFNPHPGLTPMAMLAGLDYFRGFVPRTQAEQRLVFCIPAMLEQEFTDEQYRAFREALYEVHLEQGFKSEDLLDYFPDIMRH